MLKFRKVKQGLERVYNAKNMLKYYIPYDCFLDDERSVILNKNGSLQATYQIEFADLEYSMPEVEDGVMYVLNNALKKLDENFTLHFETQRKRVNKNGEVILETVPIPTEKILKLRQEKLKGDYFCTEYYMTITYNIRIEIAGKKFLDLINSFRKSKFIYNREKAKKLLKVKLEEFNNRVTDFRNRIGNVTLSMERLKGEYLLGFLYSQVSFEFKDKILLSQNYHLDEIIGSSTYKKGIKSGFDKINDKYFATISIFDFPKEVKSRIFEELESLKFEYRFVTRYSIVSKEKTEKVFTYYQDHYESQEKNIFQVANERMTGEVVTRINRAAREKAQEVDDVINEVRHGEIIFGNYCSNIIVFDRDTKVLQKKINQIVKIINSNDFICRHDEINTFDSYLGSMAGNINRNKRRYPLSSLALTCLIPISSAFLGYEWNKELKAPALLTAKTKSNDLFNFNLHVGDVGHTMIVGQTGGGKSVLLGLLANQFLKYENAQIFFFDKDKSSRVLTECSQGIFYDLGDSEFSFQIMEKIKNDKYREFVKEWLLNILDMEGFKYDHETRNELFTMLDLFSEIEDEHRTFSNFLNTIDKDLASVFEIYAKGNYSHFFNTKVEIEKNSQFYTFEMGNIMENNEKILPLILDYLFFFIEQEMLPNGYPKLIILDEAWQVLKNEKMKNKIENWLRTLRKKNSSVVFATQGLDEIKKSTIYSVILDQCKTKIYLPNENALTHQDLYIEMGLNLSEIEKLKKAVPKKDYLYKSERGSNMISFDLSPLELAYVGSSNTKDLNKIVEMKEKITDIEELNEEWLNYKGIV